MSEPVSLEFTLYTIGVILALTAIGVLFVYKNKPKG